MTRESCYLEELALAPVSDIAALFARARDGDRAAFERLALRYEPPLRRFAYRLLGRVNLADDLVQETFLRAVVSLPGLREPERFGAWLFGIAANLAKWWWRQQARWPVSLDALAAEYPDVVWDRLEGPMLLEEVVEEAEQNRRLQAAIVALPSPLAHALVLHYLDGLSYAEMAAALHVPLSTIKGRLFKSRALLRRALGPDDAMHGELLRKSRRQKKGKEIAMADTTEQIQSRLVAVSVEGIRTSPEDSTPDNVQRWLERSTLGKIGDEPRPDFSPMAHQLAPILAEAGVRFLGSERLIMLREPGSQRFVTIGVGVAEATALALQLQGRLAPPRPFSHDLMKSLVEAGSLQVERVAVTTLEGGTFYALITLKQPDGRAQDVDARPSDAINLAVRTGAPIFVAEHLLQQAEASAPPSATP